MTDFKDPVAAYLKAAGYGSKEATKPEQQQPRPPVETSEGVVSRYLKSAGFHGPTKRKLLRS